MSETPTNPYAPPRAALEAQPTHDYWREGKVLVMRLDSVLPHQCVKCNEPAVEPIKPTKIYWHHPGWYLFVLVNILLYAVVALVVRKKATVALGLCPKHLLRRRIFLAIGWLGVTAGVALVFAGLGGSDGGLAVWGIAILLIAAIVGMMGSRIAYPSRITKEEVRLKGCGPAFLDAIESR